MTDKNIKLSPIEVEKKKKGVYKNLLTGVCQYLHLNLNLYLYYINIHFHSNISPQIILLPYVI